MLGTRKRSEEDAENWKARYSVREKIMQTKLAKQKEERH